VLYAVTKLNAVDLRSLCSCIVCGRMSLSSVVCVRVPGVPVLVFLKCVKVYMSGSGVA
jgi:hypothetical protein